MNTDSEDKAFVFGFLPAELYQQAYPSAGRLQLVEQLRFVALVALRRDFNFNDNTVLDEQISVIFPTTASL